MAGGSPSVGRRERNKQDKLERIITAAAGLFAERGVDEVTTQEIADRADIGTGTLFLYARSKGELLLLVQNAHYRAALERGRAAAEAVPDDLDAVMTLLRPIVECNRVQVDNGRTYLREMVFGDPHEQHRGEALAIAAATEQAIAALLVRGGRSSPADAAVGAHIVSAVMLLAMGAGPNAAATIDEILADIRTQVAVLVNGQRRSQRPGVASAG